MHGLNGINTINSVNHTADIRRAFEVGAQGLPLATPKLKTTLDLFMTEFPERMPGAL